MKPEPVDWREEERRRERAELLHFLRGLTAVLAFGLFMLAVVAPPFVAFLQWHMRYWGVIP